MAIELPTTHDARDDKGASSSGASLLSPEMITIIHGSDAGKDKKAEYEKSLQRWVFELGRHDDAALTRATRYALCSLARWWTEYADRKNDEDDEYVANSLLYDRNHLPRTAPAPDCCQVDALASDGTDATKQ